MTSNGQNGENGHLQNHERARVVRVNPHNGGNSHINFHACPG
jgi:hypothetical protein